MPKSIHTEEYGQFRLLLIEARKKADISQAELATKLNRPQSFVSKFERGERRLDVVEFGYVAAALGIEPLRFLKKVYRKDRAQ